MNKTRLKSEKKSKRIAVFMSFFMNSCLTASAKNDILKANNDFHCMTLCINPPTYAPAPQSRGNFNIEMCTFPNPSSCKLQNNYVTDHLYNVWLLLDIFRLNI